MSSGLFHFHQCPNSECSVSTTSVVLVVGCGARDWEALLCLLFAECLSLVSVRKDVFLSTICSHGKWRVRSAFAQPSPSGDMQASRTLSIVSSHVLVNTQQRFGSSCTGQGCSKLRMQW